MWLVAGVALELLANLEAAELGHHDVEQHQVRLERRNLVQRILPIDGHGRFDIEPAEIGFEQLDVWLVVVGDEDATFFFAFFHGGLDSTANRRRFHHRDTKDTRRRRE